MSLIIWMPTRQDDNTRWTGRDLYAQECEYTLHLLESQPGKAFMICSAGSCEIGEDEVADAAGHLGFKYFTSEVAESGVLILEELE